MFNNRRKRDVSIACTPDSALPNVRLDDNRNRGVARTPLIRRHLASSVWTLAPYRNTLCMDDLDDFFLGDHGHGADSGKGVE